MPEYLAPGVYVEEVSSGYKPIEGVSTSTAGFIGAAERGPLEPQFITSWMDFCAGTAAISAMNPTWLMLWKAFSLMAASAVLSLVLWATKQHTAAAV